MITLSQAVKILGIKDNKVIYMTTETDLDYDSKLVCVPIEAIRKHLDMKAIKVHAVRLYFKMYDIAGYRFIVSGITSEKLREVTHKYVYE